MGKKRFWAVVLVVLVVAAAAFGVYKARTKNKAVAYRTDVVQRGDVRVTVSATGTLDAVTTVQVGSQVTGTIARLNADFNDRVHAGQVLAQLDPTFLQAQVAQSEADLNRAMVQVRQALRDSARVFPLGAQGLASKADMDNAQTTLDAARAGAASSKAALDRAKTNLQYATILSPIDGVVISRNVDVGQTVAASLSAPIIFSIANDLTQMQLEASVDEADIGQIKEGQKATFTVDAYPDRTYEGEIHQIRLSPTTVQNVVTYSVILYVKNPDQTLLPGMTANVTILINEAQNILKVSSMALRFKPADGTSRAGGGAQTQANGGPGGGQGGGQGGAGGRGGLGGQTRQHSGGEQGGVRGAGGGQTGRDSNQQESPGGPGDHPRGGPRMPHGTVYLLQFPHTLIPYRVRTGLSDGTFTEVSGDSLREGTPVVVGLDLGGAGTATQGQVNPFTPRFPGGRR